jgi:hypothetical protein
MYPRFAASAFAESVAQRGKSGDFVKCEISKKYLKKGERRNCHERQAVKS